ncbi:MAG: malate synthase G [Actinomycetota bacterium]|nr:malate synthase G [Actinomycetota bacterium]MEC8485845.1 malate synthase G [Actinomycetota bacterium]MEC8520781.1 malate synthase G [Actinomycetota bacterium]MEC9225420.1 malate synthase G [Actinomycetota bacterium]MED5298249.1 malate synthase G [Actinomycetota bacterium]
MAQRAQLHVGDALVTFAEQELLPELSISTDEFWAALQTLVDEFSERNLELLEERQRLQSLIDAWHRDHGQGTPEAYRAFLESIGYLVPQGPSFTVSTDGVDPEIASIAGPQLVVPVTNARYAINAVNARWGSLYDALYGTDVLGDLPPEGPYNEERGARVIAYARQLLDDCIPLESGSHLGSLAYRVEGNTLIVTDKDGHEIKATAPVVGWTGSTEAPSGIVVAHHNLHVHIVIDREHSVGATDSAGVADVRLESAITVIMDCEDSVACVDAEDKALAYRNWLGLQRSTLTEDVTKDGSTFTRRMADDLQLTSHEGTARLSGTSLMLVRNVGHLMTTPAVQDSAHNDVPEGILDALFTIAAALPTDGSEPWSIYIVKPKMHGPTEVEFACDLFGRVEQLLGLAPNTVKIGIMDEERRTTLNLAECIRVAASRVAFINTGFLDRTGDEIHTSMLAGPMIRKADMKAQQWISAYEDNNVDVGIACGLVGSAQIGKGMWAAPDLMADMLETKINHPLAGASCAWVPSPTAATLHAIHYHRVDVAEQQNSIANDPTRGHSRLEELLSIPIEDNPSWTDDEIQAELDNNAQGILGYVVRWVDQGVGCSKVPDINDVGLMEDRATCRISSQHMANWLTHGIVDESRVRETFVKMSSVVNTQNQDDEAYTPLTADSTAFRAAIDLVLSGTEQPSGYTEPILHARRLEVKATP